MHARRALFKRMVVLAVFIVAAAAGCAPTPQATPVPIDVSLLTGEPCEPPCWQGLTPGSSTEADVNQFLETNSLVNRNSVFRGDVTNWQGDVVGVSTQWESIADMQGPRARNSFHIEDGVVQWIEAYLDFEVTLEDLLGKYGPPDKFSAGLTGIHFMEVGVSLYYPRHGFIASLTLPMDDRYLRPGSKVLHVWYCRAAPLDQFVELGCDVGYLAGTPDMVFPFLRDWQGYGAIEVD